MLLMKKGVIITYKKKECMMKRGSPIWELHTGDAKNKAGADVQLSGLFNNKLKKRKLGAVQKLLKLLFRNCVAYFYVLCLFRFSITLRPELLEAMFYSAISLFYITLPFFHTNSYLLLLFQILVCLVSVKFYKPYFLTKRLNFCTTSSLITCTSQFIVNLPLQNFEFLFRL